MARRKAIVLAALDREVPDHKCEVSYTYCGRGEVTVIETTPTGNPLSVDVVQHHAVDFMYRRKVAPKKWVVRTRRLDEKWYRWKDHKEFDTLEEAAVELASRVTTPFSRYLSVNH